MEFDMVGENQSEFEFNLFITSKVKNESQGQWVTLKRSLANQNSTLARSGVDPERLIES